MAPDLDTGTNSRSGALAALAFAAYGLYALRMVLVKQAAGVDARSGGDFGALEASTTYAATAFLVACALLRGRMLPRSERGTVEVAMVRWLLLRGVCGSLSIVCAFYGATRLPLAMNAIIQSSSAITTAIVAWLMLGERASRGEWALIVLGYLGLTGCVAEALLVAGSAPPAAYLVSAASIVLDAISLTSLRRMRRLPIAQTVAANAACGLLLALVWSIAGRGLTWPTTQAALVLALFAAVVGVSANLLIAHAIRGVDKAVQLAVARYFAPVALALIGWVQFDEAMSANQVLGYFLAIVSSLGVQALRGRSGGTSLATQGASR